MIFLKADTNTEVLVGPAVAVGDGFTPVTTLSLSTADEAEIIKYGGATALTVTSISGNTMSAITSADGYYTLDLSTSNTDTEGFLVVLINDDSLILPIRHEFMVVNANVYDSLFAASGTDVLDTNVTQWLGTAAATPTTAGVPEVDVTHVAGTSQTAGDLMGSLGEENASAAAGDPSTTESVMQYVKQLINILVGTAGVTTFPTEAAPANAVSLAEVIRAIHADVTGLNGDAMRGTDSAYTGTPPTVAAIADQVWDELQSAHVTAGSFGEIATDVAAILVDTGTTLDGKIDTIDTNVDSILVDTGTTLDDHLTDIKGTGFVKDTHSLIDIETYVDILDDATSGNAKIATDVAAVLVDTGTTLDGKIDTIDTNVDSILADTGTDGVVLSTATQQSVADTAFQRQMTESYNTDGTAPTMEQALMMILQTLSEFAISGTTITVKKLDGSTTAATFTLDDGTNPTSRTRAT